MLKTQITNVLEIGFSKNTLNFYDRVADLPRRESSISPGSSQPRPTATSNLEAQLFHNPWNVKVFRKCFDGKSDPFRKKLNEHPSNGTSSSVSVRL